MSVDENEIKDDKHQGWRIDKNYNINGITEMLLFRRDSDKSIFINRFAGKDYSIDTYRDAVSIKEDREDDQESRDCISNKNI